MLTNVTASFDFKSASTAIVIVMDWRSTAVPPRTRRGLAASWWPDALRWLGVGVGMLYALFAAGAAARTAAGLAGLGGAAGLVGAAGQRAAPLWFVAHAVSGAIALLAVTVQLCLVGAPAMPDRRRLHGLLGRWYVGSALLTSASTVPVVLAFDRGDLARAAFLAEAGLWFVTTAGAYVSIRAGRVRKHGEWMIRSAALAAFFITFSLWDPALAALAAQGTLPLAPRAAFGLAVLLGWAVNLLAAEVWIRRTRPAGGRS